MRIPTMLCSLMLLAPRLALAGATEHVILISIDGLNAPLLGGLVANDPAGDFASFDRLMREGSYTLNARTDFEYTNTMPNHTSMLTGRPVTQPAAQANTVHHGYTHNGDPDPDDTYHNAGNPNLGYVASIFDVVHDHGLRTAAYVSKSKFSIVEASYDATAGGLDVTGVDDGRAKIDTYHYDTDTVDLVAQVVSDLATAPPSLAFLHLHNPDSAGHANGWGSPEWDDAVRDIDDRLGEILSAIDASEILAARTAVILTADHGGVGTGHSNASDPENYTIPFLTWGSDVTSGGELYALNVGTRLDPVTQQRSYDAFPQPIRNGDAGNLALELLGLPPTPGSTVNAAQDLRVQPAPTATPTPIGRLQLKIAPNPFNPRTEATFVLDRGGEVQLKLFDASGRLVRSWEPRFHSAGRHSIVVNGEGLSSGSYFLRLSLDEQSATQRLVLLK